MHTLTSIGTGTVAKYKHEAEMTVCMDYAHYN